MPPAALVTADDLLNVTTADKRVELVRGVLVVSEPPGYLHGEVTARLARILGNHAEAQALGTVLAGDAGFKLAASPDTVRGPDVAFVRRERLPRPSPTGFAALAPDLVVEILSPGDRAGEVLAKVAYWLSPGTGLVGGLDPQRRRPRPYRPARSETLAPPAGPLQRRHRHT